MLHIYKLKIFPNSQLEFICFIAILFLSFSTLSSVMAQCPPTNTCSIGNNNTLIIGETTQSNCSVTCTKFEVKQGGTLIISNNSTFTINGNVEFANGSFVTINEGSTLEINGNLFNKNNSDNIFVNGALKVNGNIENGVGENGGSGTGFSGTGNINSTGSITGPGFYFGRTSTGECNTGPCSARPGSPPTNAPMPIVLKYFYARHNSNQVDLTWVTSSEINNDFFTIERSADGINYAEISRQAGAGNSIEELSYTAVDTKPLPGRSYYRLKQTDYDGTFEYSPIQSVFINEGTTSINLFPNPTSSQPVTLLVSGQKGEYAQISISTLTGKLVDQQLVQIKEQSEELVINGSTQLKQGVYIVTYKSASASNQQKLVIR
jgi:hypothetical protein